jgi:integrase
MSQKASKGTVSIESDDGRLRLRFRHAGKRYAIAIGLPDTTLNRNAAEQRARQIELDILSGNFDETLVKYKPSKAQLKANLTIADLLEKFILFKSKQVYKRSLEKYQAVLSHLNNYKLRKGKIVLADLVVSETGDYAEDFKDYLGSKLSPRTLKESLVCLSACWTWGIDEGLVDKNPWSELVSRVKVPPKQKPKPFTREEVGAIVEAFRTDRYYSQYYPFVMFLFGTGCRTGEAIGLRWKHVSDDCNTVWIGESLSRGVRKATKTNKSRTVGLTEKLREILISIKPTKPDPDALVFTTSKGNAIDDHNFRNRAWKKILAQLEIDYRKPYNTRHTLISHALDMGLSPIAVADLTGHDVETLYQNYAGVVNSKTQLPSLT